MSPSSSSSPSPSPSPYPDSNNNPQRHLSPLGLLRSLVSDSCVSARDSDVAFKKKRPKVAELFVDACPDILTGAHKGGISKNKLWRFTAKNELLLGTIFCLDADAGYRSVSGVGFWMESEDSSVACCWAGKLCIFIHSFIHSFFHSFIHSFHIDRLKKMAEGEEYSPPNPPFKSPIHSFIYSFIHSFIPSFIPRR